MATVCTGTKVSTIIYIELSSLEIVIGNFRENVFFTYVIVNFTEQGADITLNDNLIFV